MIGRAGHFLLRLCAGLAAGVVVLAGLLAVRLERGPLPVDFLAPSLATALGGDERGIAVSVDHAFLGFGRRARLELTAYGVHLSQRETGSSLTLPKLAVDLRLGALLRGVIAPARIILDEPYLRIERSPDGSFQLGLGGEEAAISDDWVRQLLRDLAGSSGGTGVLAELTDVEVRRARLILDDRSIGVLWRADDADVELHRGRDGLRGEVRLAIGTGAREAKLDAVVTYRPEQAQLRVRLEFDGLHLPDWAGAAPVLAPLAVVDLPLSGTVEAALDPARFAVTGASADLAVGAGMLRRPDLPEGGLAVSGGALSLAYDPAAGRIELQHATLSLGGPELTATGTLAGIGGDLLGGLLTRPLDATLAVVATKIPVDDFPRLWPEQVGPLSRSWVVGHIHDGTIDRIEARLGGSLDLAADAPHLFRVQQLEGTGVFHNLAVDYFKPLPPAHALDGTAVFDRTKLEFTPTAGALLGVRLVRGSIRLYQLDTNDEQTAIDLSLRGPLPDALDVLDREPLHYMRALSLDPRQISGAFDAHVTFDFPLTHRLQPSQVNFGAQATLTEVAVGKALFGHDLTGGRFKLQLNRTAMQLDGTAALADAPVEFDWRQSLNAADPVRTRYTLRGEIGDQARRELGLDFFAGALSGPVKVDLDYAMAPSRQAQATATLDLVDARLDLAKLDWRKPPGVPATARLDLDFADQRLLAVRRAVIEGGGMAAELSARFTPSGEDESLAALELRRLVVGQTDLAGSLSRREAGGWRLQLSGASFDAAGLLDEMQKAPPPTEAEPPLDIEAKLGRLVLGPKRQAQDVSGELVSDGRHWEAASVDATLAGGGKLRLRFGREAGDHQVDLTTDDFGALLRLIDLTDNIRGGKFQLGGVAVDEGARRVLKGRVTGSDYRLVGAPLVARLLSLASFSGIGALLNGDGIPFSRLTGDIVYGGGRIAVDGLRAYGGAIGVNASGSVDESAGTIEVSGTLVPAYTLNSVLGNIPILGKLLLGGEGEGVFGANFRVAGALAEPRISVNPLSALAPGVLRKLFLFEPGNPAAPP